MNAPTDVTASYRRTQSASAIEHAASDNNPTIAVNNSGVSTEQTRNKSNITSEPTDSSDTHLLPTVNSVKVSALRRTVSDTGVGISVPSDAAGPTNSPTACNNSLGQDSTSIGPKNIVFPSLSNNVLKQLGLKVKPDRGEPYTEHEIETRFVALSLAFKTDLLTLTTRLELQKRHRDQAEINMAAEVTKLKAALHKLSRVYINSDSVDALAQIQTQVDVLQQATDRVSGSAEMFGAVQQEQRLSRATEVLIVHVENIKRTLEKLNNDLEDVKRVLKDNNIVLEDSDLLDEPTPRTMRYRSLAAITGKKLTSQRRASIAAMPRLGANPTDASRSLAHLHIDSRPKSSMGMANVVNTMRMKPSLSSITALISSTTVVCDWAEKIGNDMGPIEEASEPLKEATATIPVVEEKLEAEVNNNIGKVKDQPSDRTPDSVASRRRSQVDNTTMITEQLLKPVQYIRSELRSLLTSYKATVAEYIEENKAEIISKTRITLSALLFALAAWFLLWTVIPHSEAYIITQ